jgi:type II secretory pathway predicted ATPase ExeA
MFEPRIAKGSSVIIGEWGAGKTYFLEYLKKFNPNDAILVEPLNPETFFDTTLLSLRD